MIDTVKLLFKEGQYKLSSGNELCFPDRTRGVWRSKRNPSASEMRSGLYLPRLTFTRRPTYSGMQNTLAVEFSAPKMLYGNNFDELTDGQFDEVVDRTQHALNYMGVSVRRNDIASAKVVAWHPSKNVVFHDYFATQTVIDVIHKADVSRIYNVQKTDFSDGEALHFHCNSKDIVLYDKLTDLQRSRVSDKRSLEHDNLIQNELLDTLMAIKPLSVLRFEIRFNGAATIRRIAGFAAGTSPNFREMFNSGLSQRILSEHWKRLTEKIDYLGLDNDKAIDVLQNYLIENPEAPPQAALAATMAILVASQHGVPGLRQTLDERFGRHFWSRIKPSMKTMRPHRFEHIRHVSTEIDRFLPVRLATEIR